MKATELDPEYVKGWGRLAAAEHVSPETFFALVLTRSQELGSWEKAVAAYETALSKLTKKELSASEKKQKEQYEAALAVSKRKSQPEPVKAHRLRAPLVNERPYVRATAIINERRDIPFSGVS